MSNFVVKCINGDALLSEIDDYIDLWHNNDTGMPLHAFLGMTQKEYALYVEDEQYLASIVTARKQKVDIKLVIESQVAMVARSDNQVKSDRLQRWLKKEGLWE